MQNVQSPSLKTGDEEFLKKIIDLRDYCLFVCLFVCLFMIVWRVSLERAQRIDWINVRRVSGAILRRT